MTFFRRHLTILAFALTLVLSGCALNQMTKLAEEQELTVNPSPLELHGDSVKFDVTAKLPVKMLKPNKLYTIKTYYNYGSEANFETLDFSDTEFENQKVEQPSLTKSFSFAYTDDMISGKLMIKGVASNLEKTKFKETPEMEIAKGVITTSRLVRPAYKVSLVDHGYDNREELIPTVVEFFFDKGSSKLNSTEVKGDDGKKLDAFIASKNVTRTVTIVGSHSPEGLESINSKLSEDRASVIKNFYFKKMKQYDYKGLADSIKFETKVIFQDWKPFLAELDKSSVSDESKNEIKGLIQAGGSFEDIEKKIAKTSAYNTLISDVYPQLRTSKTSILSVKPKKSDAEISILSKAIVTGTASVDTLNFRELLYSATLTPLTEEQEAIYQAASKVDSPDSWKANNNLGVIYITQAETTANADAKKALIEKALVQFNLANKKAETAIGFNNEGAAQLLLNARDEAYTAYNKALDLKADQEVSQSIKAGKGSIEVRNGDYNSAIPNLKAAGSISHDAMFNLALAQLLNKDFTSASTIIANVTLDDDKDALAYYVAAVTAARNKNITELATRIKQAITIDAALREKALKDLEFAEYWSNDQFKAAIQ